MSGKTNKKNKGLWERVWDMPPCKKLKELWKWFWNMPPYKKLKELWKWFWDMPPYKKLEVIVYCAIIFLVICLVAFLRCWWFCHSYKVETLIPWLGYGIGGLVALLVALATFQRAEVQEDGNRAERFKNGVELLGSTNESSRLGGAIILYHLAKENKEEFANNVCDVLCGHIRVITNSKIRTEKPKNGTDETIKYQDEYKNKPSPEVQSILKLLTEGKKNPFSSPRIDLSGAYLEGVALIKARLEGAILTKINLKEALLVEAHLQGAYLKDACLENASLPKAKLQGAMLEDVNLQKARLKKAEL